MKVWLQLEFPWIGYGFIGAVSESYADTFTAELQQLGFTVLGVPAGRNNAELIEAFREPLRLPDLGLTGWDALRDSLREFAWPSRLALILRDADKLAGSDPKALGEACAFLDREFRERDSENQQSVLILTGHGSAFCDPDRPSPDRALDEERNMPVAIARRQRQQAGD
jgi:hypothetical protein